MQIPSESDTFQSLLWINRVSSMAETTSWSDGSVGHKWWWWQEGDARFVISISGTRESPGEDFLLHSAGSARVTFIPRSRVIIWALKSIFCVTVCRFHSHMGPSVPHTGTVTWQLRSGLPRSWISQGYDLIWAGFWVECGRKGWKTGFSSRWDHEKEVGGGGIPHFPDYKPHFFFIVWPGCDL